MTDSELKKLNRRELLEVMVNLSRENDRLREQLQEMEKKLSDRQMKIDQAGSIAEASLQINQVFESAQKAAEQYLENIHALSGRQEEICRQMEEESARKIRILFDETTKKCQAMEAETEEKCARMTKEAEEQSNQAWEAARNKIRQIMEEQAGLRAIFNSIVEGSGNS